MARDSKKSPVDHFRTFEASNCLMFEGVTSSSAVLEAVEVLERMATWERRSVSVCRILLISAAAASKVAFASSSLPPPHIPTPRVKAPCLCHRLRGLGLGQTSCMAAWQRNP